MKSLKDFADSIKGKKVIVMGLGLQGGGVDAASFLARLGANVLVTDLKPEKELKPSIKKLSQFKNIEFVLGKHREEDFKGAKLVIKGPSVPWESLYIKKAIEKEIKVYTSISLFFLLSPTKNLIGITGTRGKTTTSYMIHEVMKAFKKDVRLLGNIPNTFLLNSLFNLKRDSWVVLELSSWQLSGLHKIKVSPKYAVFTNFYPDHLNFYKNQKEYFYDKAAIFLYQSPHDFLIFNKRFKYLLKDCELKTKLIYFSKEDFPWSLKLLGEHNQENAAAVFKLSQVLELDKKRVVGILSNFSGLPYRLEKVGESRGIIFVNDSTSTTPVAGSVAIQTFSGKRIFLILGGDSKNLPFKELEEEFGRIEKAFFLKGSFTDEFMPVVKRKYGNKVYPKVFNNLKEAVLKAFEFAKSKGGVVLFSPSATSFSLFRNEFERAEVFNKIVKEVILNEKAEKIKNKQDKI